MISERREVKIVLCGREVSFGELSPEEWNQLVDYIRQGRLEKIRIDKSLAGEEIDNHGC